MLHEEIGSEQMEPHLQNYPKVRLSLEEITALLPGDASIWRGRAWTWREWEDRTGLYRVTLAKHFRRRGFQVTPGRTRAIRAAPCARCRRLLSPEQMSSVRLCDPCGAGTPETIYRLELRAHLARITEGRTHELTRPYTHGAPRRRGLRQRYVQSLMEGDVDASNDSHT